MECRQPAIIVALFIVAQLSRIVFGPLKTNEICNMKAGRIYTYFILSLLLYYSFKSILSLISREIIKQGYC